MAGVPCYKLDVFTLREDEPVRVKCACLHHKLLPRHFAPEDGEKHSQAVLDGMKLKPAIRKPEGENIKKQDLLHNWR